MDYNNKPKANWVKQVNFDGVRLHVSDKGALKLTKIMPSGEERFIICLTKDNAEAICNASGDLANFLASPEYAAIEAGKEMAKERNKIATQLEREKAKAMAQAQAAIEALKRLGLDVQVTVPVTNKAG